MRVFIEPTEPLLFRTGRPFQAGENNFAETIFPPTPETLQGALRAMIATQWGRSHPGATNDIFSEPEVVELIGRREGNRNVYGRFRITGITLGYCEARTKKVSRLFPAPAHIIQATLKEGTGKKSVPVRLVPRPVAQDLSNHPEEMQLLFPELGAKKTAGKSEPFDGWLPPLELRRALSRADFSRDEKAEDDICIIPAHQIYVQESRLGIGMNNATKTTREGYLYQAQMIRMQPHYGFVVDIELGKEEDGKSDMPPPEQAIDQAETLARLAFLKEGWLTLGGEQRAARFKVLQPEECVEEPGISRTTPGKLLYFATPAYFKNGWLPAANMFAAKPVAAALNHYQSIGGWLLNPGTAGGASKLTRRCIPAGSVYYFNKDVRADQPLTEYGWQIGYGIAYTGEY